MRAAAGLIRFGGIISSWLEAGSKPERSSHLSTLKAMFRDLALLRQPTGEYGILLCRTDMALASRYAELVPDERLRNAILKHKSAAHERTVAYLAQITDTKERLEANPLLARLITNPLHPLIH